MNKCYSCGATYDGYSCPNCAVIKAGRENAQKISDAIRDSELQRQAEVRRAEQQRENEAYAAREALRRSLLSPEQREQEDIERAEQARMDAIRASIQAQENEKHENAVNAITFFIFSFFAIAVSGFFSKSIYGYLSNPETLNSPYNLIASFYRLTVFIPFEFISTLHESWKVFIYKKISYPNLALVTYLSSLVFFAWLLLSFIYRLFRYIGKAMKILFLTPFVFGLTWFFGSILLSWLLKK